MAAGDRKIKLLNLSIPTPNGGEVIAEIRYAYRVEDKAGQDADVIGGNLSLNLGIWSVASAMTLAQIRTAALAKLNSDGTVPPHDSAS